MLSSVEQAFMGRDEKRAPLKTPAWEAMHKPEHSKNRLGHQVSRKLVKVLLASTMAEQSLSIYGLHISKKSIFNAILCRFKYFD